MARLLHLVQAQAVPLCKEFYALEADIVAIPAVLGAWVTQADDHLDILHESAHQSRKGANDPEHSCAWAIRAWILFVLLLL